MRINHSKFKNTGILLELLIKQVTSDTLNGKQSPALNIIKKYFTKGDLYKDYRLYETLSKKNNVNKDYASNVLETILEYSTKLNRNNLGKQKYNLIKEIKEHYDLDELFKTKIPNYKIYAAFYTLTEIKNLKSKSPNLTQLLENKTTILEYLSSTPVIEDEIKNDIIKEYRECDKDIKILAYKILLEKFNKKYENLSGGQKEILKEYINSVDNTSKLRNFYNKNIINLKETLEKLNNNIKSKQVSLKINEILPLMEQIDKSKPIRNKDLINLMQYHDLIENIKEVNG
jgi:hypothetical protein